MAELSAQALGSLYPSLPEYCNPQTPFLLRISAAFHTCVPTNLAFLSTLLGSLSILSWLFAQVPQILKNYSNQSTSGLSVYFLLEWCLGDTANLLGALFTGQATWQQLVAGYYVCVDVILVYQYTWYTHIRPWREGKGDSHNPFGKDDGDVVEGIPASDSASGESSDDRQNTPDNLQQTTKSLKTSPIPYHFPASSSPHEKGTTSSSITFGGGLGSSIWQEKSSCRSNRTITRPKSGSILPTYSLQTVIYTTLLLAVATHASPHQPSGSAVHISVADASSDHILAGRILSWLSTLLYLGSRLPQIYKNARLRSTAGLAPALFIAAFFGNLFYSTSILTNPLAWGSYPPHGLYGWVGEEGSQRTEWVKLAVPFWLGAAGVLMLDATVGAQFLMYGEGLQGIFDELLEDNVEGGGRRRKARGHLRKISGWMRGWVPSGSFLGKQEVQRPLLDEQRRDRSRSDDYGTV